MSSNQYRHAVAARAVCGAAELELGDENAHASLCSGAEAPKRLIERGRGAQVPMLVRFAGVHDRNQSV